jgi:predicted DNA-binding transcriptional regulator YafY
MGNLHRIQWIDSQLREGTYPNCTRIAENFEISIRQAARDVEYLKYTLGAPVEYSFTRRGFCYTEQTFVLPALFLDGEEREALHYLADRYRQAGGELTARLATLFEKIDANGEKPKSTACTDIPVYTVKAGLIRTYGLLREAAAQRKKVRISYTDSGRRASERVIRPYVVFLKEKADYVHAFCETRQAERDFRLDRITSLETLGEAFSIPPGFDPARYTADYRFNFRIPYVATIRFDHPLPPHHPLDLDPIAGGHYAVRFSDSAALLQTLLSFSRGFSIVTPWWLRKKCFEFFTTMKENNSIQADC